MFWIGFSSHCTKSNCDIIHVQEFTERWEVDRYLSASGYLGENTRPFFVALPKDRGTISNDEFRRQISQVDAEMLHYLRDSVKGGFDEEKYRSYVGFGCLRDFLEAELQRRYKEAAPATLALLEQRCGEVTADLARMECKINATSDVAHLRKSAMLHAAALCNHVVSTASKIYIIYVLLISILCDLFKVLLPGFQHICNGYEFATMFCCTKFNVSFSDEIISELVFLLFDEGGTY